MANRIGYSAVTLGVLLALVALSANATGPQRTFVSSGGNDANPCSLTLPCRSFAAAITAVADSGEVIVLDSGGYGPFTIDKSVTVAAPTGVYAGISVPAGVNSGVHVNAPNIEVTLKGLTITGLPPNNLAAAGILFTLGRILTIENCEIVNLGDAGASIYVEAPGGRVAVKDTVIRQSPFFGIWVNQGATGQTTTLVAENVAIYDTITAGIVIGDTSNPGTVEAHISHLTIKGTGGVLVDSTTGGPSLASITNSTISGNGGGVLVSGATAKVVVATSVLAGNTSAALIQQNSGTLLSRGDNTIHDNNRGGAQTSGAIGSLPPL
jgi:hypothetical protein